MFHLSSRHHFDTMFVIVCVIAGATSHFISNSNTTSPNFKLQDRHKSTFINLLLYENLFELVKPPLDQKNNMNDSNPEDRAQAPAFESSEIRERETQDVCAQLSNILSGNQIKYCHKHHDILESILPQVVEVTKRECLRVTKDLRWNCGTIDSFLDRSNALAFTREAALVRSILNASMMYLIVKTCSDQMHRSCGCQTNQEYQQDFESPSRTRLGNVANSQPEFRNSLDADKSIDQVALDRQELKRLETGSPLRLTRSMMRHQGCNHNTAFADALTGVFMDADDIRSLNKAYKILNDNSLNGRSGIFVDKRSLDADYKDLSFIKWTKSALSLHNNRIGRQVVRDAKFKQCKCHGVSGMCQFQTCWDQLLDFKIITTKLREIYLNNAMLVEVKNLGSYANPDLYLTRSSTNAQSLTCSATSITYASSIDKSDLYNRSYLNRLKPDDLAYLYESPNYCDAQPITNHLGTSGRQCDSKEVHEPTKIQYRQDIREESSDLLHANKSVLGTWLNATIASVNECFIIVGEVMLELYKRYRNRKQLYSILYW